MKVQEAYEIFKNLVDQGKGELEIYSEYERLEQISEKIADESCDGCQVEMEHGTPFVEIYLDH